MGDKRDEYKEFRRINFFDGFFTNADDWQDAQKYHLEKRRFHNKYLHTPGVVSDCLNELTVTATQEGDALYIAPGYAVDGEGRDLYLPEPRQIPIEPQSYRPPVTVYVVIQYNEERFDRRENHANPEHSDYAFIRELPKVDIVTDEPDNYEMIEIARIQLSEGTRSVKTARNPESPTANEIDLTHVKRAGAVTVQMKLEDLGEVVKDGTTSVASSEAQRDAVIPLEEASVEDAHRFYLVSAYPESEEGEAQIAWHIELSFSERTVRYRLVFRNLSEVDADVTYRVYRLY